MSCRAIVGINWGDEGKGRMVDLLTESYDIVVRYQGGGNAGHTVVNEKGKFALHLLPSGILREGTVNVLGDGVALDPENLMAEIEDLRSKGISVTPENLKISSFASLLFPWHRDLDSLEESRLGDAKYGSTKQGIAPFYADRSRKKTILAGELLYPEAFRKHLQQVLDYEDMTLEREYGARSYTIEETDEWVSRYCVPLIPFICDTGRYLTQADTEGRNILFEAQLGAMRDLDRGIWPYTTSSNTTAAYIPVGAGMPAAVMDDITGVVKAYSTCVGEGPFVSEWTGEEASRLREEGAEYGAKTGRARRVGSFDCVATRYGVERQNATELAVTKLDVLSYMDRIPVCTAYRIGGEITKEFPFPSALEEAKPVTEYLDGWRSDISSARNWEELPEEARRYVSFIEQEAGCPVVYISVGPERESIIIRKDRRDEWLRENKN